MAVTDAACPKWLPRPPVCHTLSPGGVGLADQQFLYVQYLIVINIASVNLKIINPKYPVACSRSVGAAGERDLLIME